MYLHVRIYISIYRFVEPPVLNMAAVVEDSTCRIPLIFVLSPGVVCSHVSDQKNDNIIMIVYYNNYVSDICTLQWSSTFILPIHPCIHSSMHSSIHSFINSQTIHSSIYPFCISSTHTPSIYPHYQCTNHPFIHQPIYPFFHSSTHPPFIIHLSIHFSLFIHRTLLHHC